MCSGLPAMAIVKLRTRDGKVVEVEWKLAQQSLTIASTLSKGVAGGGGGGTPSHTDMPLTMDCPTVSGAILSLAFSWLKQHINDPPPPPSSEEGRIEQELTPWDETFFRRLPLTTLYELILAADNLRMVRLMHASTKTVAQMMIGKSPAEIRHIFEIPDDL